MMKFLPPLILAAVFVTCSSAPAHGQRASDQFGMLDDNGQQQARERTRRPPRDLWKRLTAEEREDILSFIEEHFPEVHTQLQRHRKQNTRVPAWMRRHLGGFIELMEIVDEDPERGKLMISERRLDMRMTKLASRYRNARTQQQRDLIEKKVLKLCGEWFDTRLQLRAMMIGQLEQRLATLKERHEQAESRRGVMIEREVKRRLQGQDRPQSIPDVQAIPREGP